MPAIATLRPLRFLCAALAAAVLLIIALQRLTVDTRSEPFLPVDDPVIADAVRFFDAAPTGDHRVTIVIHSEAADRVRLLAAARSVEERLLQSGLFRLPGDASLPAELAEQMVERLPTLFDAADLEGRVAPLLGDEAVRRALTRLRSDLAQEADADRRATLLADPLGLHRLVLDRPAASVADADTTQEGDRRITEGDRHLAIQAIVLGSSATTAVTHFWAALEREVTGTYPGIAVAARGAFGAIPPRPQAVGNAALRGIPWALIGIAALLSLVFSRPAAALTALLPALMGAIAALFCFSLFRDAIPMEVLAFGGAIIAAGMDGACLYLCFGPRDDRDGTTPMSTAWRVVAWPAAMASIAAFGLLTLSGWNSFGQLGLFAGLGIGFALLFVHLGLPRLLPAAGPSPAPSRQSSSFIERLIAAGRSGLCLALVAAAVLIFVGYVHFTGRLPEEDPSRGPLASVYLMTEADDLTSLQDKNDGLLDHLDTEAHAGRIAKPPSPARAFPGPTRSDDNLRAWNAFWTGQRIRTVNIALHREGAASGFPAGTFDGFVNRLSARPIQSAAIPEDLHPFFGIAYDPANDIWRQITPVAPEAQFDSREFYRRIAPMATVFDAALYAHHLQSRQIATATRMLLIGAAGLTLLAMLWLADAGLAIGALLPPAFTLAATLGTLRLLGQPPDLSTLMLPTLVLGMGGGYALLLIRGYQHYGHAGHPGVASLRKALTVIAVCHLIGFGTLAAADAVLMKRSALMASLAIGYALISTLFLLPPLLARRFTAAPRPMTDLAAPFAGMPPYHRLMARYRLRMDPLFEELPALLPESGDPLNILDLGSGYGLPACWLADRFPGAFIHGIEPRAGRVHVANLALGKRGSVVEGALPAMPPTDVLQDLALMLDVSHYLQDWELEKTLQRVHARLMPGGCLIVRSLLPGSGTPDWRHRRLRLSLWLEGAKGCFREAGTTDAILGQCGFEVLVSRAAGHRGKHWWHVVRAR